jgi:hypothetical protein
MNQKVLIMIVKAILLSDTSDTPVARVSNDNGATFGPMLMLATNGTIGGGG